jgi:hypothetical protein
MYPALDAGPGVVKKPAQERPRICVRGDKVRGVSDGVIPSYRVKRGTTAHVISTPDLIRGRNLINAAWVRFLPRHGGVEMTNVGALTRFLPRHGAVEMTNVGDGSKGLSFRAIARNLIHAELMRFLPRKGGGRNDKRGALTRFLPRKGGVEMTDASAGSK